MKQNNAFPVQETRRGRRTEPADGVQQYIQLRNLPQKQASSKARAQLRFLLERKSVGSPIPRYHYWSGSFKNDILAKDSTKWKTVTC